MLYRMYIPKAPLAEFVELFWLYDGFPQGPHKKERLMPDGSTELVINLRQDEIRVYDREKLECFDRFGGSILCGPHSNFFVIDTEEQASVIGIHFKPGGAFPFFKLPVDELRNQHISLGDLWGAEANLLRERLLETATPEAKFQMLEDCLIDMAFKPLHRHPAVGFALKQFGNMDRVRTIAEVTEQIGLSSRRF